jgi:probable rRNA maturation factor
VNVGSVLYFTEDIQFRFRNQRKVKKWIIHTILSEKKKFQSLNIIFCSDSYLHTLNVNYLQHDTLTDIITFDNSEVNLISGELFISIPRVKENANLFHISFYHELHRVIIHGVLHLLGYSDKTSKQQLEMRKKEDIYLSLLPNFLN